MSSRRASRFISFVVAIGMFIQPAVSIAKGSSVPAPSTRVSVSAPALEFAAPESVTETEDAAEAAAQAAAVAAATNVAAEAEQAAAEAGEASAQTRYAYDYGRALELQQMLLDLESATADVTVNQDDTETLLADQVKDQIDSNGAALVLFQTGISDADAKAILAACGMDSVGSFTGSSLYMATPRTGYTMESALALLQARGEVVAADSLSSRLNQEGSPANEPGPADEEASETTPEAGPESEPGSEPPADSDSGDGPDALADPDPPTGSAPAPTPSETTSPSAEATGSPDVQIGTPPELQAAAELSSAPEPVSEPEPVAELQPAPEPEPGSPAPEVDPECEDGIDPAGYVTDSSTGMPVRNATVTVINEGSGAAVELPTDETGHYAVLVSAGEYLVTAAAQGYTPQTSPVTVIDAPVYIDFALVDGMLPRFVSNSATPSGSALTGARPLIGAVYWDAESGIAADGISLLLDGLDVTLGAIVGALSVRYQPVAPLLVGRHDVKLTVRDRAGNAASSAWEFFVDPSAVIEEDLADLAAGVGVDVSLGADALTLATIQAISDADAAVSAPCSVSLEPDSGGDVSAFTDGDESTAIGYAVPDEGTVQTAVTLDLGLSHTLGSVTLKTAAWAGADILLDVLISTDGLDYTSVGTTSVIGGGPISVSFAPAEARFVRFAVTASTSGIGGTLALFEGCVYAVVSEYAAHGTFESRVIDLGSEADVHTVDWAAVVPEGTELKLQVAALDAPDEAPVYVGPDGTAATYFATSGTKIPIALSGSRYLRYRVVLSTVDPESTPALSSVSFSYDNRGPPAATAVTITTPATGDALATSAIALAGTTVADPGSVLGVFVSSNGGWSWQPAATLDGYATWGALVPAGDPGSYELTVSTIDRDLDGPTSDATVTVETTTPPAAPIVEVPYPAPLIDPTYAGTAGNDAIYVEWSGGILSVWVNKDHTSTPADYTNPTPAGGVEFHIQGLDGDDVITLVSVGAAPFPPSTIWLEGGAGADTLNASGFAGNVYLVGGIGNDILRGGSGSDTYVFTGGGGTDTAFGADTIIEIAGGTNDRVLLTGYSGAFRPAVDGAGTLVLTGSRDYTVTADETDTLPETITIAQASLLQLEDLTGIDTVLGNAVRGAILDGFERLVQWVEGLVSLGDFGQILPILAGANIPASLANALDVVGVFTKMLVDARDSLDVLINTADLTLEQFAAALGGITSIERYGMAILGERMIDASLIADLIGDQVTIYFRAGLKYYDPNDVLLETVDKTVNVTVYMPASLAALVSAINAELAGLYISGETGDMPKSTTWAQVVQAVVTSDGRLVFDVLGREVADRSKFLQGVTVASLDSFRVEAGSAAARSLIGFDGERTADLTGSLDLGVTRNGPLSLDLDVTPSVELVAGKLTFGLELGLDASADVAFWIDLGEQFSEVNGLTFDASAELPLSVEFESLFGMTLALDATPSVSDLIMTVSKFEVGALISPATVSADIVIGFLGAHVSGTIDFGAGVAWEDLVTPHVIVYTSTAFSSMLDIIPGSVLDVSLTATVDTGLRNADGTAYSPAGATVALVGADPFDPSTYEFGDWVVSTDFTNLFDFNSLRASDIPAMLRRLAITIENLANTTVFSQFRLPFVSSAIDNLLDFVDGISDRLLIDDRDDADPSNDIPRLLDAVGQLTFSNAQELAARLSSILGLSAGTINATYDAAAKELLFTIDLSSELLLLEFPMDFSFDLGPIAGVSSNTRVILTANAGIKLTFGFDVSPWTVPEDDPATEPDESVDAWLSRFFVRGVTGDDIYATLSLMPGWLMRGVRIDATDATKLLVGASMPVEVGMSVVVKGYQSPEDDPAEPGVKKFGDGLHDATFEITAVEDTLVSVAGKSWRRITLSGAIGTAGAFGGTAILKKGIEATAHFGFVSVMLKSPVGAESDGFSVGLGVDLKDPNNTDGKNRITLADIRGALGTPGNVLTELTFNGIDAEHDRIRLEVVVSPSFGDFALVPTGAQISIAIARDATSMTGFKVVPDLTGLGDLSQFSNLDVNFTTILTALQALSEFLGEFETFEFLSSDIPLIGKSVNDLLGFASKFAEALEDAQANPAGSLQALEGMLTDALGLPVGHDVVDFSLVDTGTSKILRMDLFIIKSVRTSASLNLPGIDAGSLGLLTLSGAAGLSLEAELVGRLAFGIDLSAPTDVYLFDDTILEAWVKATGTNLSFSAALGPISLGVKGGSALIEAAASVAIAAGKFTYGRVLLADLMDNILNAVDLDLTAGASTTLPVTFSGFSLGSFGVAWAYTYPGAFPGEIAVTLPTKLADADSLDSLLGSFSFFDSLKLIVGGVDGFLDMLQGMVSSNFASVVLPMLGDQLANAAQFINDFRRDFVQPLSDAIESIENAATDFADPQRNLLSIEIFKLLGPAGLNVLKDGPDAGTDISVTDVVLGTNFNAEDMPDFSETYMQWVVEIGDLYEVGSGIAFDLGVPGLGLETTGAITLVLQWSMMLGFGLSGDKGFYLVDIPERPELAIDARIALSGVSITGKLAFLELTAADEDVNDDGDPSLFGAQFALDVTGSSGTLAGNPEIDVFGIGDFGSLGIEATAAATARAELGLTLGIMSSDAAGFPTLKADFILDFGFGTLAAFDPSNPDFTALLANSTRIALTDIDWAGALHEVGFLNIRLDLGSFISNLIGPTLGEIADAIAPLKDITDAMTDPIPVISDLMGDPVSLADLAEIFGECDLGWLDSVDEVLDFIVMIGGMGSAGELYIPFGDFPIYGASSSNTTPIWELGANRDTISTPSDPWGGASFLDQLGSASGDAGTRTAMNDLVSAAGADEYGFSFPLFDEPTKIFQLFMGKDIALVEYRMKPFMFDFEYSQFFPIIGPLGVSITGGVGIDIRVGFGYSTRGIRQFVESDFKNVAVLLDGFYLTDCTTSGEDIPEIKVWGGISAAAQLNLLMVEAGVAGGIYITVNFNLNDPNNDGMVHFTEMAANFWSELRFGSEDPVMAALSIFDVYGDLSVRLWAFLKVDLFFFSIDWEQDIVPMTPIVEFSVDFYRGPVLATSSAGYNEGGDLIIHVGAAAEMRSRGDLNGDAPETITVRQGSSADWVLVSSSSHGGTDQEFKVTGKIIAKCGAGDDVIDLSGVTAAIDCFVDGGAGNDTILAPSGAGKAILIGGPGNDSLTGGAGDDQLWGGAGSDTLDGKGGRDILFGDEGVLAYDPGTQKYTIDVVVGNADADDTLAGGDGSDAIFGGGGKDTITGGGDADVIFGDTGSITFKFGSIIIDRVTNTEVSKRGDADTIDAGAGDDFVWGGVGNDVIQGGAGRDFLFGESGFDEINGGAGDDDIFGDGWVLKPTDPAHPYLPASGGDSDKIWGGGGNDYLWGGGGEDVIEGGADDDYLYGGAGNDTLWGDGQTHGTGDGMDHIYGQLDHDTLYGGDEADTLDGGEGDDVLFGAFGPNSYESLIDGQKRLSQVLADPDDATAPSRDVDLLFWFAGADLLDGQGGSDEYRIDFRGGEAIARVYVLDSGASDDGIDAMRVDGTAFNDIFLLRAVADVDGAAFVAMLNPEDRVERVDYDNVERLVVNGQVGNDKFFMDDAHAEVTLNGGAGQDTFQIAQLYRSERIYPNVSSETDVVTPDYLGPLVDDPFPRNTADTSNGAVAYRYIGGDQFATEATTRGFLSNGCSVSPVTANGGPGNDFFVVFHNMQVANLNGEAGDDVFLIKAFALAGSQEPKRGRTDVSGGDGTDLVQYVVNAPVNIDGGDGFDRVIIVGTEFGDDLVITKVGVYGAGLNVNYVNIESLEVDGAEGDDRFYVQSTSEKFVTRISGGLGNDTFSMSGDVPPVISNDLLGHSGIITHGIEVGDELYETDLKIEGISVNVADNEEPAIRITQTAGETSVTEGSAAYDSYTIVLTRQPVGDVLVRAMVPSRTPTDEEMATRSFRVVSSAPGAETEFNGSGVTLLFTEVNWDQPQEVLVYANISGDPLDPLTVDYDDEAYEGTRYGFINHTVEQETGSYRGSIAGFSVEEHEDDKWIDGIRYETVVTVTHATDIDGTPLPNPFVTHELIGATFELVGGDGIGQRLLIKDNEADTLWLFGKFRANNQPVTDGTSTYLIRRYHYMALPSVLVKIYDNDTAGVAANEVDEFDAPDGITAVIENGDTDRIAVRLTREPVVPVQVRISNTNGELTLSTTLLTFNTGPGWDAPQYVTVTAINDADREGRHYGLIRFEIVAGEGDQDVVGYEQKFELTETTELPDLVFAADVVTKPEAFIGLRFNPKNGVVTSVTTTEEGQTRVLGADEYYVEGNLIVFTDDRGIARTVTGLVTVVFDYVIPGYLRPTATPLLIDPVNAEIADDEVPNVIIRETEGTTNVIETGDHEGDGAPWTDDYYIVLAKAPTGPVTVVVTPQITKSTRGRIRWDLPQVEVSSTALGATMETRTLTNIRNVDFEITVVLLTFTPDDWDQPRRIVVTARDDDGMPTEGTSDTVGVIDGADTQVFAPKLHTVADIQGPVYVEGAGGSGSLVSPTAQMLQGERNVKEPAGYVVEYSAGEITTITVGLDEAYVLAGFDADESVSTFINRTVEITSGSAIDQFRLITALEVNGEFITFTLNEPYVLAEDDVIDASTQYAITRESLTFFVDESKSIDFMFVYDDDSVADSYGRLSALTTTEFPNNGTVAEFVTKLEARRLTGLQMGEDLYIGGYLQPGGITYGGLEVVEIDLGSGDNVFQIDNTHYRPDFQTWTMVNTGKGDDEVTVAVSQTRHEAVAVAESVGDSSSATPVVRLGQTFETGSLVGFLVEFKRGEAVLARREIIGNTGDTITLSGPWDLDKNGQPIPVTAGDLCAIWSEDGPVAVNGQTGNDRIDDSDSTIPLVLFGSEGDDQLWGGSAADIIFGDCGRVDYYDEDGRLVTRLGVDRAEMVGLITTAMNLVTSPEDPATWTAVLGVSDMWDATPFTGAWYIDDILLGTELQTVNGPGFGQFLFVLDYTEDTLTLRGNFDPMPVGSESTWRIPILPENQTDGVVRAPTLAMSRNRSVGGMDMIFGRAGDDLIFGGADTDLIIGDSGYTLPDDGADLIVGDNGRADWDLDGTPYDGNLDTIDRLYTLDPLFGDFDGILGDGGDDLVLGGTGGDYIMSGAGNDMVLGDFGEVRFGTVDVDMLGTITHHMEYPLFVTVTDDALGGADIVWAGTGEDVIVGGAYGDLLDGGADDDLIYGDNVVLDRVTTYSDFTDPRFRTVDSAMYDLAGNVVVGSDARNIPALTGTPVWGAWDVALLYHDAANDALPSALYGDDYIAGGADDDMIFGQLGDDTIQGDGSIDSAAFDDLWVSAARDGDGLLSVIASFESETDGDDYIEGNGGNDTVFGGLGQDDIIGGSSNLFSLTTTDRRPDGADLLFGGAGCDIDRSTYGDDVHVRDADTIAGDNANIYRVVAQTGEYRTFNYDTYAEPVRLIPRAVELLDYTPGGPDYDPTALTDVGAADEIHGESGDDWLYGMVGDDVIFGESEDDDIIGGWGNDWVSGGTGQDGVLGDDGRILTSRNSAVYDEPLYGIAALLDRDPNTRYSDGNVLNEYVYTPGRMQEAIINVENALKKTVNLTPFNLDPIAASGSIQDPLFNPAHADDIIYGGLGGDFLHGGAGDDAISGAEALGTFYASPYNPGDVLQYALYKAGEFALYDEYFPRTKVAGFLLNFDATEGPEVIDATYGTVHTDGNDVLFGDLGNDWVVGGTGKDTVYGGYGDDLLNVDDDHDSPDTTNTAPDTHPDYEDRAYGGAGRDVLIANTGGDRLIDWVGEFNSYIVPFAPFGAATVSRALQPHIPEFLYALSASHGADPTRSGDTGAADERNGEPEGELGLVLQKDDDWHDQTGAPDDPQPGNIPGGSRDVLRSASFNDATAQGFAADSGTWTVTAGRLQVEPEALGGEAVSVFYVDAYLPQYYEVEATINAAKPLAGYKSNAYLIFDYRAWDDFKFAGINISTDKLELGYRDATGWHVVAQTPSRLKPDVDYKVLLSVNATYVTVVVNGVQAFAYVYAPHIDADGFVHVLNESMVGIGANNSKRRIDNVSVQVLPPEIVYAVDTDFSTDPSPLLSAPVTGEWELVDGAATVAPDGVEAAIALTRVTIDPASLLCLEADLSTTGAAGVVFDYYDADDYKFAWLDVTTGALVLGHMSHGVRAIDATVTTLGIKARKLYTLDLNLQGNVVSVIVDGTLVYTHVYNALITDGASGLIAAGGASTFDYMSIGTNDADPLVAPADEYWSCQLVL
ncbi:MAG: carboxypeptidase regulatory-like domain-containing protein [Coriobacteriia bacterium]